MARLTNLEVFTPGDYIREELEARGWTQADLAEILGRPLTAVNGILVGHRSVTPETAHGLAAAFDTSAQLWLNLEASYQLARTQSASADSVSRKARLYSMAPIKEMQRRGWIEETRNIDSLEAQLLKFFQTDNLAEPIVFSHAARKSTDYSTISNEQSAWLCRARQLARSAPVTATFTKQSFGRALDALTPLKAEAEEIRHLPRVMAEAGIRFLLVEHLRRTKIDGACFWLDKSSPVIALSMRYDRIDWFWFTLMHEIGHLKHRDGLAQPMLDSRLVGDDAEKSDEKPEHEKRADKFATASLIEQDALDNFIARVHPLYSHMKILGFAKRLGVHPGIVVGQLQNRKKIAYAHSRRMLVKVRNIVASSALTDGWGHTPQTD